MYNSLLKNFVYIVEMESFSKETILSEWKELIEQFVNLSR